MLTNEQLTQLETRLLEQLHGEDGDLAMLMAHVAQLTTHNCVMQVALAQFSDGDNWCIVDEQDVDGRTVPVCYMWEQDANPQHLAEVALVNTNEHG